MPRIGFTFHGWVNGADVSKATVVATGEDIDVSDKSAAEVIKNLENGTWTIALGDYLYDANSAEIEIENYDGTED